MLSIFVILFFLPHLFALDPYTKFTQLNLPPGPIGPESVALDRFGQGPYVGVSDGRILKYKGPDVGFVDFAYTKPNRSKQFCDGVTDPNLGPTCGRPLGFSFSSLTGELYVVDAFLGLFKVGPEGGQATFLANSAGGIRLNFPAGIDIDPRLGYVYLSDASLTFDLRNLSDPNLVRDSSGRLIRYNPLTKEVKVLLDGLFTPVGPAVSEDSSFVLVSENSAKRVKKYYVTGPKANTTEILLGFPGNPAKVKRASIPGEFWVAVTQIVQQTLSFTPFGYKIDASGKVLLVKNFSGQYNNIGVTVVQEYIGLSGATLYTGSRQAAYVGKYST